MYIINFKIITFNRLHYKYFIGIGLRVRESCCAPPPQCNPFLLFYQGGFYLNSKLIANFYLFPFVRFVFHPFAKNVEKKVFNCFERACNFLHLLLMVENSISRLLLLLFCAINQMIFAMLVTATIYKCIFNWKTFLYFKFYNFLKLFFILFWK